MKKNTRTGYRRELPRLFTILILITISYFIFGCGEDVDESSPPSTSATTGWIIVGTPSGNTAEDGTQGTFQVKLKFKPDNTVRIDASSDDTTEGTTFPSYLIFTP